jgi:serine/threonine protein kinase
MVAPSSLGMSFGRYRLVEQLGEGGMAAVYRAVVEGPEGFERPVVLKRILPQLSRDPRFVKMFLTEARLCARLHHPSIVQVHALGDVDGEYFLAMEYVDGMDLATLLRRAYDLAKPMPIGVACWLVSELASALGYAHALTDETGRSLEIVHRDVSPSNIMVTKLGAVKLLDFGIARAAAHARMSNEKTRSGTLKGKVSYMAPEQADGHAVDARADLFALGIILYECLTLERLFRGEDEFDTLRLVRECKTFPPSTRRPEIEPDVDQLVGRLLQKAPEARFQSGDDVVTALAPIVHKHQADANQLKRYLAELGQSTAKAEVAVTTPAKRNTPSAPPQRQEAADTSTRSLGELQARPRQRGRTLWALIGAAGVAGTLLLLQVTQPKPPPVQPVPVKLPVTPEPTQQTATQPVAPVVKTVHLTVRGLISAEVRIDGKLAGKVPLTLELPARPERRDLVISRAGFLPLHRALDGDADSTVDAELRRRPHESSGQPEIKDPFAR